MAGEGIYETESQARMGKIPRHNSSGEVKITFPHPHMHGQFHSLSDNLTLEVGAGCGHIIY
jgi:hypothetical protein